MYWLNCTPNKFLELDAPFIRDVYKLSDTPKYLMMDAAPDVPYDQITLLAIHSLIVNKLVNKRDADAWWRVAFNYHTDEDFDGPEIEELTFWIYDYVIHCLTTGYYVDPDTTLMPIVEFCLECYVAQLPYDVERDLPEDVIEEKLILYSMRFCDDSYAGIKKHWYDFRRLHKLVTIYNNIDDNRYDTIEELMDVLHKGFHEPPHLWRDFQIKAFPESKDINDCMESLPIRFDYLERHSHFGEARYLAVREIIDDPEYVNELTQEEFTEKAIDYPTGFVDKMQELLLLKDVYTEYFNSKLHSERSYKIDYIVPKHLFDNTYGMYCKDISNFEAIMLLEDFYHPLNRDKVLEMASLASVNRAKREAREGNRPRVGAGKTPRVKSGARNMRCDATLSEFTEEARKEVKALSVARDVIRVIATRTLENIGEMTFNELGDYADAVNAELILLNDYLDNNNEVSHENQFVTENEKGEIVVNRKPQDQIAEKEERDAARRAEKRERFFKAMGYYPEDAPAYNGGPQPINQPIGTPIGHGHHHRITNHQPAPINQPVVQPEQQVVVPTPEPTPEPEPARKQTRATGGLARFGSAATSNRARANMSKEERAEKAAEAQARRERHRARRNPGLTELAKMVIPEALGDEPETETVSVEDVYAVDNSVPKISVTLSDGTEHVGDAVTQEIEQSEPTHPIEEAEATPVTEPANAAWPTDPKAISLHLKDEDIPFINLYRYRDLGPDHKELAEIDAEGEFEWHSVTAGPDGNALVRLIVQDQHGWARTFFRNTLAYSAMAHAIEVPATNEAEVNPVTGEKFTIMYPWNIVTRVLPRSVIRPAEMFVPAYNAFESTLFVYFDAYGKLYFRALKNSEKDMEDYKKHQIDADWVDAEMQLADNDILASRYTIQPAGVCNPTLEYNEEDNLIVESKIENGVLPVITASDTMDAAASMTKLVAMSDMKRPNQIVESIWCKDHKVMIDAETATALGLYLEEWKLKPNQDRAKLTAIDLLTQLPLNAEARSYLVSRMTDVYNDLIRYNLGADIVIEDVVSEWPGVEARVRQVEGDAFIGGLATTNTAFRNIVLAMMSNIKLVTEEEYFGAFSSEVTNVVFTENHSLTMLPWTTNAMGLDKSDLRGGVVLSGIDDESGKLRDALLATVRRVLHNCPITIQLLTADGQVLNVGASQTLKGALVLYTK